MRESRPLGRLELQDERPVRAGTTCVMICALKASSRDLGLLLVNDRLLEGGLLEDRLLDYRLLDRLLQDGRIVNIGTHRGHIVGLGRGLDLVMARMVSVDVGSVGGVGHLRLEMDASVGGIDVAGHGDGTCGDDSGLAWIVDEVGGRDRLAVRESLVERLIEGSGVVQENLLTGGRDWRGVVVDWHSRNSWLSGTWAPSLLAGLLTARIVG